MQQQAYFINGPLAFISRYQSAKANQQMDNCSFNLTTKTKQQARLTTCLNKNQLCQNQTEEINHSA